VDGRPDDRPGPTDAEVAAARRYTRRREPRYLRIIVLGVAVGMITAVALVAGGPGGEGAGPALGYLLVALGTAGAVLGALVALALGALARRGGR
jgi:peptidoglycan/LPS O-acetylase OafA/YrhL